MTVVAIPKDVLVPRLQVSVRFRSEGEDHAHPLAEDDTALAGFVRKGLEAEHSCEWM
jgi:hypothetical protein